MEKEPAFTEKQIAEATGKSITAVNKKAKKEKWPFRLEDGNGYRGKIKKYPISTLPTNTQNSLVLYNKDTNMTDTLNMIPDLSPSVAIPIIKQLVGDDVEDALGGNFADKALINMTLDEKRTHYERVGPEFAALMNPRVQRIARIIEEALAVPPGWKSRKWVEAVAEKYEITFSTVYRYIDRHRKKGLVGLEHTKSTKGQATAWTKEALNYWLGLCFKREHRKIKKKYLYPTLQVEARRRGWRIGTLESGMWHYRRHPNRRLLEAYQRGGMRALDNALPPILRDYSDMAPFECLVGDQHRKNRWVVDDFTGNIVRIEAYVWQDLRTRIIYGGACAHHYDAWLMGLALRMGLRIYGAFSSVYNDNGKPEISLYFKGILKNLRHYGLDARATINLPADLLDVDHEEVYPACEDPQLQRLAIVQNAKAKMIEGTWRTLEDIMTSVFLLPGNTKTLCDDIHNQDIDQQELKKLAAAGQLPLFSQYLEAFYRSLDYYNKVKPHRGVLKEWAWPDRPKSVTPYDCLMKCYDNGWRPRYLSNEAIDLLFMAEEERVVNRGYIAAFNDIYTHDDLLSLHGSRVKIRYDLVDRGNLLVFNQGQFICMAAPVEYSSMKDIELAKRKIIEKRRKAKEITDLYNTISRPISDIRTFSTAEQAEQVAALVTAAKEKKQIEYRQLNRDITQEELDAEVAKLEAGLPLPPKAKKALPAKPKFFMNDETHFKWCIEYLSAGGALEETDEAARKRYLSSLTDDQQEYWQDYVAMGS